MHQPDERTLDTQTRDAQTLRRLAHDVKNALNGVAVNLEVARTRAARGVTAVEQLTPYLDSAAQQLDAASKLHKQFADLASGLFSR